MATASEGRKMGKVNQALALEGLQGPCFKLIDL
jgi:hypothetical protein